ncbi:MAG: hypothetical protein JXA37_11775 [Chloroflexia bacterium]|nr:hypothetical protein [Chloroflexia bacterium]
MLKTRPGRVARWLWVLLLLVVFWPAPLGQAQSTLQVEAQPAVGEYPEEIVFPVMAASSAADIVSLELSYRVVGSPYTRSRWPDFSPALQVEASYRLDTQVEHYAPGTTFHYYWTAEDAVGNVVESEELVFSYTDNRFEWDALSTERVAVHWYEGGEDFGQELLEVSQRALDRLERDVGVEAERQIKIYVYGSERDFRGALGPNSPEWIGGQALPALSLIIAYIRPESSYSSWEIQRMIPHELSHVVLYQETHNPYTSNPNWLEEGIAVHNQEVADEEYPDLVAEAARNGTLIPLRALSASFPSDPDLALLSYAESLSVVEFILAEYGPEGLAALVDVFAEGETAEAAVPQALGISLDALEAGWRATLPAAERTPVPGSTPFSAPADSGQEQDLGRILRLVASALACTFFMGVLVIVAVVVLVVRRRRRSEAEGFEYGQQD